VYGEALLRLGAGLGNYLFSRDDAGLPMIFNPACRGDVVMRGVQPPQKQSHRPRHAAQNCSGT